MSIFLLQLGVKNQYLHYNCQIWYQHYVTQFNLIRKEIIADVAIAAVVQFGVDFNVIGCQQGSTSAAKMHLIATRWKHSANA